jgi:hypothetical protein
MRIMTDWDEQGENDQDEDDPEYHRHLKPREFNPYDENQEPAEFNPDD